MEPGRRGIHIGCYNSVGYVKYIVTDCSSGFDLNLSFQARGNLVTRLSLDSPKVFSPFLSPVVTVPILDFWGPYAKLCRRRAGGKNE